MLLNSAACSVLDRRYRLALRPRKTISPYALELGLFLDIVNLDETAECLYRISCKNCDKVYIGETGRSFGVRMKEHQKEVEAHEGR